MQEERKDEASNVEEDALLLISGSKGSKEADKEYAKKISGAVLSCISKYGVAKLRCCGVASSNNAIKGIAIAKNELLKSETPKHILISPTFTTIHFGEEERRGIMVEAIQMEYEKDGNLSRDDAVLKVRGWQGSKEANKEYVKKLAKAVLSCFANQGVALLRFVGAASGNNALKAATIAKAEAVERDLKLMIDPSFTLVKFDEDEKTGMILEVISI
jgi:stage V sporulation protein SpoVS